MAAISQQQLRGATISSQVQAQARKIAQQTSIQLEQARQSQEARGEQAQQISQQVPKISKEEIEMLIWYPWGEKFASLPKETQRQLEQAHQNAIGGVVQRGTEKLSQSDILKNLYAAQTGEITGIQETTKVVPTTPTQQTQETDVFGRNVSRITSTSINIGAETARYKQLGYSEKDASKLAKASASAGGMSFSPEKAKEIIKSKTPYGDTIRIEKAITLLETSQPSISLEKEKTRYKILGYTKSEADKLARASISRGGISFSPDTAKEILKTSGRVLYKPEEIKKTPSGKVETYSSFLDAFISESPTGRQGTVSARAPTTTERLKLEQTNEIENILTMGKKAKTKIADIELTLSKIESIDSSIEALEKDFVKDGEFTGSKKYRDMYEKKIKEREMEIETLSSYGVTISSTGQINYPTIKMKFFGETQEVPITEVSKGAFNLFGSLVGEKYKKSIEESKVKLPNVLYYTGMVGEELGRVIKEPSRVKDYVAPKSKYVMDLTTGVFREVTKEDTTRMTWKERGEVKPESIWTTEEIARGAYGVTKTATIFGLETGKYALASKVGVGVPLMVYETAKGVGEEGGVVQFVKERPIQAVALAGMALFKLGKSRAVQSFFGTKLRFGMLPQKGVPVLQKKIYFDILPSKIKQERINLLAQTRLQTDARGQALNLKERIALDKKITLGQQKLGIKSKSLIYEGGVVVGMGGEKISLAGRVIKEYSSIDVGKGTTLWSEIKSSLGKKEFKTISKEGLLTIRKFETRPASGKLVLSPDVGVYKGIQVVPRVSTQVGKRVNVLGVGGTSKEVGGTITNLEGFVGAGEGRYIVFKSWKTKVGRKSVTDYGLVGKEIGTQIAKVTKVKSGYKVEYRQLPQDKNLYQYDVQELLEKRVGKKTFERGIPIKTELLKYKEVPTKKGYQLDVLLKPEETLIRRSVILKKDILGSVTNIPTKVDETGKVISLVSGKKTSLSSSFGQVQQQVTKQELTSVLKKVTPVTTPVIKVPKVVLKAQTLIESQYPAIVGGTAIMGKVGYETTTTTEFTPTIISTPKDFSLSLTGNVVRERVDTSIKSFETTDLGLKVIQKQDLGLLTKQVQLNYLQPQIQLVTPKLKEIQAVTQTQSLLQTQTQRQEQKQLQQLKTQLLTKQVSKQKLKVTPKVKIKVPVPFKLSSFGLGRKPSARETLRDTFEVYIGKKGKERKIGEEFELMRAGKSLRKGLKLGIEAGGFVKEKKTGRKIKYEEIADILGAEFRPSVSSDERIIQRKEKIGLFGSRLGSIQERRAIQSKRKKKMRFL
jgi:hypothetical protein